MTYAGDITVQECWEGLRDNPSAQIVDVRTVPEWQFVGVPDLQSIGKEPILVEWQKYPDMAVNVTFAEQVAQRLEALGCGKEDKVFMLCRSGVRSIASAQALTAIGYTNVFNVLGGFEGDKNEEGHRATIAGWQFEKCPWRQ